MVVIIKSAPYLKKLAEIAQVSAPAPEGELTSDAGSGWGMVGLEDGLGLARADLASASTGSGVYVAEIAPVSARGRFWADLASASTGRAERGHPERAHQGL
jgi:hypothetical protein